MTTSGWRRQTVDGGSGTVLALALIVVVLLGAGTIAAVGAAIVARHRAAAAADAAALTGARALAVGTADPCASAGAAAGALGARLVQCRTVGADVDVVVEAAAPPWLRWAGAARLNARAGPAGTYSEKPGRPAAAS